MMEENQNIEDPKYVKNVYNALKSKVQGFDKTEQEFASSLSDPNYVKNVHNALSQKVQGFNKTLDEFSTLVVPTPLKKKDNATSTSTTKTENLVSVPKDGSLAIPKSNIVIPTFKNGYNKNQFQPLKENQSEIDALNSHRIKKLENDFYSQTTNKNDEQESEQRLKDKLSGTGFLNSAASLAKKTYNKVIGGLSYLTQEEGVNELKISEDPLYDEKKEVKQNALKNKEAITDSEVNKRAQDLFKQKEKQNLFIDRANSFLDNLPEEDRLVLKQDRAEKATHLQEDNMKRLKLVSAMQQLGNDKIKDYKEIENKLVEFKNNNQPLPQDLYGKYQSLGNEIQQIGTNLKESEDYILKNKKDLGTVNEELDLFKREYGDLNNFIGNLEVSAGELGTGLLGFVNYAGSFGTPSQKLDSLISQGVTSDITEKLSSKREKLRKPVESIESPEGFLNYTSDLIANQIPNLLVTSTGVGGLAAIGASSTGQKFTSMSKEVMAGEKKYSPLQMAAAPLLYGGAEVISEIPTLSILKKGGRVLESMAKNEGELIANTAKEKALEWAKDYGIDMSKEMSGEQFTNFAQNFNDKYVLGNKDVNLLDNTGRVFKDTFTLTSILKAAPQTFGVIAQQFQTNTDLNKLDENSKKIIDFSKQLNSGSLTDVEKEVVQKQIDKITSNSSKIVANTIKNIGEMPGELYDKVISLNSKIGEIKSQAVEIKEGNLENKEDLLKGLEEDYKKAQEQRINILNGSVDVIDILPVKQKDKLKKEALKEITLEKNPDGKKKLEVKDAEIKERANEIYLNQIKDEAKSETPIAKTEPQAEIQKPTNEVQKQEQEILTTKTKENAIQERSTEEIPMGEKTRDSERISGKNAKSKETNVQGEKEKITSDNNKIIEYINGKGELSSLETKNIKINENGNKLLFTENGNRIGHIQLKNKNGNEISVALSGIFNPSLNKKGIGTIMYKKTAELLKSKYNLDLVSDTDRTKDSEALWAKLEREGNAVIIGDKSTGNTKDYKYKFVFNEKPSKSDITSNANIRSGTGKLAEVGVEQQKEGNIVDEQKLQPATVAKPDKSKVEVKTQKEATVQEKMVPENLPDISKKGDVKSVPISENIEAKIQVTEDLSGESSYKVEIFKNGEIQEDKNGDTEIEFGNDEQGKLIKFIEDKRKGFSLSKTTKTTNVENTVAEKQNDTEEESKVSFTVFGIEQKGTRKKDGSFVDLKGTIYPKSIVKDIFIYEKSEPIEEKSIAKKFDEQLANWDKKLEDFGKETLGIHLPLALTRGAIKAMRAGLQAGMTAVEAIKEGIEYIKNTDWYKNLDDNNKALIDENSFKSVIDSTIKANEVSEKTIETLREKIKDGKISQKQLVDDVKTFLVENSIDGLLTPNQANTLIKKSNNILVANNPVKAFDEFINYYNLVKAKSESKIDDKERRKLKYDKMKQTILELKTKNVSLNNVISQIETSNNRPLSEKEKQMVTMIYKSGDVKNMTAKEAKSLTDEGFAEIDKIVAKSNKTFDDFKKSFTGLKKKFIDAQATAKLFLEKNGLDKVKDRLIALKGASGLAEKTFESAKEKIYKGLNSEQHKNLDQIIQLRRIIAIDENRAKIGMPPILHTKYVNGEIAKKSLEQYKKDLGEEQFNDLDNRADSYFNEFRTILNKMESNGLINEQTRKQLFEVDYQPRKFLQHMLDANEEISENKKSWQKSTANLSADQIMSLDEGSVEAMITNSEWLLGTYMNMRERSMAMNNLNSKLASEFNKKFLELELTKSIPKEQRNKKDRIKIKNFEELQKIFVPNPIIGVTKSGNAKYKFDKAPNGYRTAYYYKNGVQQKFFIKEDIYEEWYNEKKWFGNPELIENISILSGSKLLKNMATGRNPFFLITNTPRDFLATLWLSPEYSVNKPKAFVQLGRDLIKSTKAIAQNGDLFDKYFQYGGGMSFLSMQGELTGKSVITSFLEGKQDNKLAKTLLDSKVKETTGKLFDWVTLHEINTYSEMVFRLSIFDRAINNRLKELGVDDISKLSKEQQDDIYFSAVASARSIMDFNQGGYITKDLESFMPYLNAATQGTRVLASSFIKRPLETTAGMLQIAAMGTLSFIGLSALFLGLSKDDDDERATMEIYLDNLSKVSPYDRRNFFIVFTGKKDDQGNPQYIKIAKSQQITPFTEASEHFITNLFKREYGMKEDNDLLDKMLSVTNDNISPIEFKSFKDDPSLVGTSLISRNPYGRAVMTYATGYDFYRQEKLSWDIDKKGIPKYMEGYTSDRVDDFYKVIGEDLEVSPIRMKAAIESIVTSPSTNPFLGILYGGLDATLAEGSFKERGEKMLENTMKNINKRVVNYGKDYNSTIKEKEALQKQVERIQADNIKFNEKIEKLGEDYINKKEDRPTLVKKLIKEAQLQPYKADRAIKKILDKQKYKDVDQFFIDLKWEESNEVKALMLYDKFGDFSKLPADKQKEYAKQLDAIDFNFNDEIIYEYKKLKEKYN